MRGIPSTLACISFPTLQAPRSRNLRFFSPPCDISLSAFLPGWTRAGSGQVPARLLEERQGRGKKRMPENLSGGHARFNP